MFQHSARAAAIFLALPGLFSAVVAAETRHPESPSGWHLVRTANPRGGPDAVSISHTADISRSDLDLAGLMLRCGEKSVEVVIVVVTPLSPRARPDVTISADHKEWRFVAQAVSPGALLLPAEATSLAGWTLAIGARARGEGYLAGAGLRRGHTDRRTGRGARNASGQLPPWLIGWTARRRRNSHLHK